MKKSLNMKKLLVFIMFLILLIISIIFIKEKYSNDNYEELVELQLPKNSKIIKHTDTHSGIHGDGTELYIIKLDKKYIQEFINTALKNPKWNKLPIESNLNSFLFGYSKDNYSYTGTVDEIPSIIKNGAYYFKDNFAEKYPDEKNNNLLNRSSNNFIFSILDSDTCKLYIFKYDS